MEKFAIRSPAPAGDRQWDASVWHARSALLGSLPLLSATRTAWRTLDSQDPSATDLPETAETARSLTPPTK